MRLFDSGGPRRSPWPYDAIFVIPSDTGSGSYYWADSSRGNPQPGQVYSYVLTAVNQSSATEVARWNIQNPDNQIPTGVDTRVGVMLVDLPTGSDLEGVHPKTLRPPEGGPDRASAQSPDQESAHEWRDFSLGFGLKMQQGQNDRRYRFAQDADASIANQLIFGPKINALTPSVVDATNGYQGSFEIAGGLYAINGRYVQKRTSDADWNTGRKDFGAGNAALEAVVFWTNVAGGANYAYVAMGDSNFIWRFDGTTWTQSADLEALCFCSRGRDLFRALNTNEVSRVDTDANPWTAANWTADNTFTIGDKTSTIVRMMTNAAGQLVILKTDGVYVLDETGQDWCLYKFPIDAENGRMPYFAENWIYATFGRSHYRFGPDMGREHIGPEKYADNDSVVRGYITAGVETDFANYCGVYNPDTGNSYLLKFGAWVPGPDGGSHERIDAWHGSLSNVNMGLTSGDAEDFGTKKIHHMRKSAVGAPTAHSRCYIFTSDGLIHWFILPCVPNPAACTSYEYSIMTGGADDARGRVFVPYWHGGFPSDEKLILAAATVGTRFSSTARGGGLLFSKGGDTAYAYTQYPVASADFSTAIPGNRYQISGQPGSTLGAGWASNPVATLLGVAIELQRLVASAATATPVQNSTSLLFAVHPPIAMTYQFHVVAEDGLVNREGRALRVGRKKIQELMKYACGLSAGVTVILPNEVTETMTLTGYTEGTLFEGPKRKPRQIVSFNGASTKRSGGATSTVLA